MIKSLTLSEVRVGDIVFRDKGLIKRFLTNKSDYEEDCEYTVISHLGDVIIAIRLIEIDEETHSTEWIDTMNKKLTNRNKGFFEVVEYTTIILGEKLIGIEKVQIQSRARWKLKK